MRFAAFIITYERHGIVIETIERILSQTIPPSKILVVDNSETLDTKHIVESYSNPVVSYYRTGKNVGPAGGAAIGLKILAEEGFEWIYWGDDDDPPDYADTFEILLNLANSHPDCGCVGAVGHYFNRKSGVIERVATSELLRHSYLEVGTIAGGMHKILRGDMVREFNVWPDSRFFFGFEDLDIDLKIYKAGFKLYVDSGLYLRHRKAADNLNYKRSFVSDKKDERRLKREYYSLRNILRIYVYNGLYTAFIYTLFKFIIKILYNFRFGVSYGLTSAKYSLLAINDFIFARYGKRI